MGEYPEKMVKRATDAVSSALENIDTTEEEIALSTLDAANVPDILEALREARMELRRCSDPSAPKYLAQRAADRARKTISAAIAKAEGGDDA